MVRAFSEIRVQVVLGVGSCTVVLGLGFCTRLLYVEDVSRPVDPLKSEYGTSKTVKAICWPRPSGRGP